MDAIKVAKVPHVLCSKSGSTSEGTLHLTAHHLIFHYDGVEKEELWIPYPLISLVTRLVQTLQGLSPLAFRTRAFESFTLFFQRETEASDVFDSVKELTVATSITQLYAFFYQPSVPTEGNQNGWHIYNPREEFGRMGVGTRTKAWRFSDVNKDYSFCPTYPAKLIVPTKISDATLTYASRYRSKARIPTLAYLHWANYGTITRSSQPMVGLTNSRSIQDEKLIEAIFQSHFSPDSPLSPRSAQVYGATATNLIIDARPTTNAMANVAKGAGTENMDYYKDGKKAYLGVDNIHVMRDSLAKVVEALMEADTLAASPEYASASGGNTLNLLDRQALRRSGWLRHISAILDGTLLIVRNVHINSSHVLIHCSDGWDRTAQLSSLAQLCLDPFYRTVRGFQILIEKDWLSFGHKFADRCGHLSSEKFFLAMSPNDDPQAQAQAFLASVQNRFVGPSHLKETSPVFHQFLECVRQIQRQFPTRFEFNERFLERIHYHLYSCQFGTFLFNCERERRVGEGSAPPGWEQTRSAWDWFNSEPEKMKWIDDSYDSSQDNPKAGDMGVLMPDPKDVRFWNELYGRSDADMNGRIVTQVEETPTIIGPVESSADDPITGDIAYKTPLPPSPSRSPALLDNEPKPLPYKPRQQRSNSAVVPASPTVTPGSPSSTSASFPNLAQTPQRPASQRSDSFRPYSSTSSAFSLRPASGSASPQRSSTSPPTPREGQGGLGAFSGVGNFGGGLWRGVLGNASAALSAVQDAAKDFKGFGSNPDNPSSRRGGGEMVETGFKSTSGSGTGLSSSPSDRGYTWGTESLSSTTSLPRTAPPPITMDNPWSTPSRPAEPTPVRSVDAAPRLDGPPKSSSPPLQPDPPIVHPTGVRAPSPWSTFPRTGLTPTTTPATSFLSPTPPPLPAVSTESNWVSTAKDSPLKADSIPLPPPSASPSPAPEEPPKKQADPLGVGLF